MKLEWVVTCAFCPQKEREKVKVTLPTKNHIEIANAVTGAHAGLHFDISMHDWKKCDSEWLCPDCAEEEVNEDD